MCTEDSVEVSDLHTAHWITTLIIKGCMLPKDSQGHRVSATAVEAKTQERRRQCWGDVYRM